MLGNFIVYKQTADVYRLQKDAHDTDLEGYQKVYSGLRVNIQPAGLSYAALMANGEVGKMYMAYTTYSGCKIGMKILTSGTATISGMQYAVEGVEEWNGPIGRHFEILLRLNIK